MLVWGPHIINDVVKLHDLEKWQPPTATLLSPNIDYLRNFKKASPKTKIVTRLYHDDHWYNEGIKHNPKELARENVEEYMRKGYHVSDYCQTLNEPVPYWSEMERLIEYNNYLMDYADEHDIKVALFQFSVGQPDLPEHDRMAYWRLMYETLRRGMNNGHILGIHEYAYPILHGDGDKYNNKWYLDRYIHQVHKRLPEDLKKLKVIKTETGIDHLIVGRKKSWKSGNKEEYLRHLDEIDDYHHQWSDVFYGENLFTFGTGSSDWVDYDHIELIDDFIRLAKKKESRPLLWENKVNTYIPDTIQPSLSRKTRVHQEKKNLPNNDKDGYLLGEIRSKLGLKLRKQPNIDSEVICVMKYLDKVRVFENTDSWYSVEYIDEYNVLHIGYCFGNYVRINYDAITVIRELAEEYNLPVQVITSILKVESNEQFFVGSKLIIRFEAHIFNRYINNSVFTHNKQKPWTQQRMNIGGLSLPIHTGTQDNEYKALELAKNFSPEYAYRSISMGGAQLMGFNFARCGFKSAEAMFKALSKNEEAQIRAMFKFISSDKNMLKALQTKDWLTFATLYNGPGQAEYYSNLIQESIKKKDNTQGGMLEKSYFTESMKPESEFSKIRRNFLLGDNMPKHLTVLEIEERIDAIIELITQVKTGLKYLSNTVPIDTNPAPQPEETITTQFSAGAKYNKNSVELVSDSKYYIESIFTTYNGNWEVGKTNEIWGIEHWARDKYLLPFNHPQYLHQGGGDHHIFAIILDEYGNRIEGIEINYQGADGDNSVNFKTDYTGSTNLVMYPSSSYDPEQKPGYWQVQINDNSGQSDIAKGIGLPMKRHISTFVIFRKK